MRNEDVPAQLNLAERLRHVPDPTVCNGEEPSRLAFNLLEISSLFQDFLDHRIPELLDPATQGAPLGGLLVEIMLDLQHIVDHILDPESLFRLLEPVLSERIAERKNAPPAA